MICERGVAILYVFPVIRPALRIWIHDGSFFPPFRYGNIIGTMVATNEAQTCRLPVRVLLSRLFEILSSKEAAEERRRSI